MRLVATKSRHWHTLTHIQTHSRSHRKRIYADKMCAVMRALLWLWVQSLFDNSNWLHTVVSTLMSYHVKPTMISIASHRMYGNFYEFFVFSSLSLALPGIVKMFPFSRDLKNIYRKWLAIMHHILLYHGKNLHQSNFRNKLCLLEKSAKNGQINNLYKSDESDGPDERLPANACHRVAIRPLTTN